MADPTIAELAEDVARQLGEEYTELDTRDTFDSWTIETVRDLLEEGPWPWTKRTDSIATVASTETVNLATGVGLIQSIHRSDAVRSPLVETTKSQLAAQGIDLTLEDEPRCWYPHGTSSGEFTIGFWPIPDAIYNYSVELSYNADSISRTSQSPFPDSMSPLIKKNVRRLFFLHAGDVERSEIALRDYTYALGRAKGMYRGGMTAGPATFQYSDVPRRRSKEPVPDYPIVVP